MPRVEMGGYFWNSFLTLPVPVLFSYTFCCFFSLVAPCRLSPPSLPFPSLIPAVRFGWACLESCDNLLLPLDVACATRQSRSTAYRLMAVREILVKAQKELAAKSSLKDTLG